MNILRLSFILIGFSIIMILITLCMEGRDFIRYFIYKEQAMAKIHHLEGFLVSKSRGLVEKQDGDSYIPISSTQDKSNHKFPFFYYNKIQAIFTWNAENTNWRARYPHMRKAENWNQQETILIHYSKKHPWKYAFADKHMWANMFLKLVLYIGFFLIGYVIFEKLQRGFAEEV